MNLGRMNLSVAILISLFSVVGCKDHEKAAAPAPMPVASMAVDSHAGDTTLAATKSDGSPISKPEVANAVAKTASDPKSTDKQAPSSSKSSAARSGSLEVKRLVVARGVEGREPVNAGTAFWKGDFDRLYAFVELSNPQKEDTKVMVKFIPPSGKGSRGNVTLAVGASKRWRTWGSSHSIEEKGTWTAVVMNEDGHELARQTFDIL